MNIKPNLFKLVFSFILALIGLYIIGEFYILGETNFFRSLRNLVFALFLPSDRIIIYWVYLVVGFIVIYFLWSIYEKKTLIP